MVKSVNNPPTSFEATLVLGIFWFQIGPTTNQRNQLLTQERHVAFSTPIELLSF